MSNSSGDKKDNQNKGGPLFPFGGPNLPDLKPFGGWKFLLIYIAILFIGISLFNYVFLKQHRLARNPKLRQELFAKPRQNIVRAKVHYNFHVFLSFLAIAYDCSTA